MALNAGTRLGPYEIADQLGAGGMGEVYRATDTRLDRTVAIKVFPEHLASDPQRRERFEREAKAVSSLNHPHICTLHDVGEQDGVHYLVMELVEGETLGQRLEKGRLPLDQALEHAIQIADALDKAHRQGVVHRDLKPGNIMLTKSAGVKLLDFGLAKLKGDAAEVSPLSQMPTQDPSAPLTAEGTIIGTLQYMAPEQLEGKEADARTDIFAFGALVYEMVTGKKAFEGASQASLIGAILKDQPRSMRELQDLTPASIDHVVQRCLAKQPDERWQTATDLFQELRWIRQAPPETEARVPTGGPTQTPRLPWIVAAAATVAAIALAALFLSRATEQAPTTLAPTTSLVMSFAPGEELGSSPFDVSPDGTRFVYIDSDTGQLRVRRMDTGESILLPGTEAATAPFFSHDELSVGFFAEGELKRVPAGGGTAPAPLAQVGAARGGSWGSDDHIVYAPQPAGGLWRVSADGGTPEQITTPASRGDSHRFPTVLPGGKAVLFSAGTVNVGYRTVVRSLETDAETILIEGSDTARYVPTGHILYLYSGALMAVPFDPSRLEVTGQPVRLLEDVDFRLKVSDAGTLFYVPALDPNVELAWVDRDGEFEPAAPLGPYFYPRISPDGRRFAVGSGGDIWLGNDSEPLRRLTQAGDNVAPVWTPDGGHVTFASDRAGGSHNVFWQAVDGGAAERLTTSTNPQYPLAWSPDGRFLLYVDVDPVTGADIWVRPLEGEPWPLVNSPFQEANAQFSPDGRWVAYYSNRLGPHQIFLQSFPDPGEELPFTTEGGRDPIWTRGGREIVYWFGGMMAVDIVTAPTPSWSAPTLLFDGPYIAGSGEGSLKNYDVTADGERFLMVRRPGQSEAPSVHVIVNWLEELKERVPVP